MATDMFLRLQTLAEESDEDDPQAIHLDGEDSDEDETEDMGTAGRQLQGQKSGRKPQPSSVKLEARKAAQEEQAARSTLKQQRRDIANLSGMAAKLQTLTFCNCICERGYCLD